ncbi:MAG: GAF domain-containing protein, partial [Phycisphaerales bacterium]
MQAALAHVPATPSRDEPSRTDRMRAFVDAGWNALHEQGISWIGFYLEDPGAPDEERLVLGPSRNKPACSPIGMHGACGQAFLSGEVLIVQDVRDLDENYVACDPHDQSELIIPVRNAAGKIDAVLDLDSFEISAFDADDAAWLQMLLAFVGDDDG